MEQLRDIKGLVEIPFPTLWLIIAALALVCLLLLGASLWYRSHQRKKAHSVRAKALLALKQMDFSDAKEAAYCFTHNGYLVLGENSLHVKNFETIVQDLEAYKFKKEVPSLDEAMTRRMQAFIKEVSHV
ncbi:hypothetical protein FA592_05360 [Sulfurospirillum diekertiae]|uniref:Uncharacterized protein n=1 Tax=Sulfurospirillum diekertiae TaxID=1854492 RepID=A0A6G9VRU7_9BACT|nr:DUF4381 family protein [Sulfurospirillum diekertiae]QIR75685.1 hypothetical protein FA584_05460 [Sulfurospirillum diekertiae]QIR78332.1 hypothetical protein FA592_05360 [Sulfurospirillum diekertiae]